MTWTHYCILVFGGAGVIMGLSYLLMWALWPWLRRNKWVIGDWEDWR